MRSPKSSVPVLAALFAIVATLLAAPAFADNYQIVNLGSDQGYFFYGMNDSGLVVIDNPVAAPCGFSTCYYSFLNGSSLGFSAIVPTLTADNGTACAPSVPAGGSVQHGVCNNGRDAFTGFLTPGQVHPNIYVGPSFQDIFNGGEGLIFMNGLGNIVFDDHFQEEWFLAIDLSTAPPTPEPGGLLLLATGLAALMLCLPRRVLLSSHH